MVVLKELSCFLIRGFSLKNPRQRLSSRLQSGHRHEPLCSLCSSAFLLSRTFWRPPFRRFCPPRRRTMAVAFRTFLFCRACCSGSITLRGSPGCPVWGWIRKSSKVCRCPPRSSHCRSPSLAFSSACYSGASSFRLWLPALFLTSWFSDMA